jgi:hypothetical protein
MFAVILRRGLLLCGLAAMAAGLLKGQEMPKPEQTPIHTLHVYTNLIQVPTLVLSPSLRPIAPIAANRFMVSVDSGPKFQATHVRQEGDDPISLAILLDARGPMDDALRRVNDAIAGLAPLSLRARDHVSLYALDCSLVRALNDAPVSQDALKLGVDSVLQELAAHRERHRTDCKQAVRLRAAMAFAIGELSKVPGRRVMLALTNGDDQDSKETWKDVKVMAQSFGVAVFGVDYVPYRSVLRMSYENEFNSMCELSGGMLVVTDKSDVGSTLKDILKNIRERYIVEFPRPSNSTAGYHNLLITIEKSAAFIRPSGISLPIADPAVLADPTTVPSDPSLAPVQGTRRVLTNPN